MTRNLAVATQLLDPRLSSFFPPVRFQFIDQVIRVFEGFATYWPFLFLVNTDSPFCIYVSVFIALYLDKS